MITRRNQRIGIKVSLYRMEAEDPSCQWQNDCEHGNCVGHRTKKLGLSFLAVPWEWCEECRKLHDAKTKAEEPKAASVAATPQPKPVKRFASGAYRRTLAEELAWAELRMTPEQFANFAEWANSAKVGEWRHYRVPRLLTDGVIAYDCTRIE